MRKRKSDIRNVVVVSDLHAGSRLGLYPRDGVTDDDGGRYMGSANQRVLWSWWEEFWDDYVPKATKGEPFAAVVNGDIVDGKPHLSKQGVSDNCSDQSRIALACLDGYATRGEHGLYIVKGTEAHVGKSAENEEGVARLLGAIPDEQGNHARWDLWLRVGGKLVHFLHHIGTTSSASYESTAVMSELVAEFVESARWGDQIPSAIVRSHRHRTIEIKIPTAHGLAMGIVTPAWQLKTSFAWKIAGARLAPPQIGGVVLRVGEDGELYSMAFVRTVGRTEIAG